MCRDVTRDGNQEKESRPGGQKTGTQNAHRDATRIIPGAGSVNSALHEFMLAMGFHHEHSRYDRDGTLYLDGEVCGNDKWFYWLRLKLGKSEWQEMDHPLGHGRNIVKIIIFSILTTSMQLGNVV